MEMVQGLRTRDHPANLGRDLSSGENTGLVEVRSYLEAYRPFVCVERRWASGEGSPTEDETLKLGIAAQLLEVRLIGDQRAQIGVER
jgi:hypothetical protein